MAISLGADGPRDTMARLREHGWGPELDRLAGEERDALAPLGLGEPYQVRYLSVEQVVAGDLLDTAPVTRWRHLLTRGERPVAEVELDSDLAPLAVHEGPAKDGLAAAIVKAESLDGHFDACVLQSSALKFIALLLRSPDRSFVIPFPPNLTELPNYEAIPVSEAIKVLQYQAASILEATSTDDISGG